MPRKIINYSCKYCNCNTKVIQKPIYVDSYKRFFCDLECFSLQKELEKNENRN